MEVLVRIKRLVLYVIKSYDYRGTFIYTKGRIDCEAGREYFYVLISAKIAT